MFCRSLVWGMSKVLCEDFPCARLVTFNKPKALNALDLEMVEELHRLYVRSPPTSQEAIYVLKGAGGKAFCAGGDVVSVTTDNPPGCRKSFFYTEYQVNYHLMNMNSPNVSLWNGYVMGGGVGMSIHGKYRVATENACFAMPETAIGMFPDVGGTWFLPRLQIPGLGTCLGLTGMRVKGADLRHAGLATHFVPFARLEELEKALCHIKEPHKVGELLASFEPQQIPTSTLEPHLHSIKRVFVQRENETMESIMDAVKQEAVNNPVFKQMEGNLAGYSPSALCLTLEALKRGKQLPTPADAFKMEYRMTQRICLEHDFKEGVRALLIDKDKKPKWSHKSVKDVTPQFIESFFCPSHAKQAEWDPLQPIAMT